MKIDNEKFRECFNPEGDNFVGTYIFQPLGRFFARIFLHTPLTPNQITVFWGLLMAVSAFLLATGNYYLCIAGGILWVLSYSMDFSDGIVARYKNIRSSSGDFLDFMVHRYTYPLLMTCIGWGVFISGGTEFIKFDWFRNEYYILFGVLAGVSINIFMSIIPLYNNISKTETHLDKNGARAVEANFFKNQKMFDLLMSINPLVFTNMMVLIPICACLNILWLFIIFYAIGYFVVATVRAVTVFKKIKKE